MGRGPGPADDGFAWQGHRRLTIRRVDDVSGQPTAATDDADARRDDPALVVFMGSSDLKRLRLLRRGFRHCFVAVFTAGGWVICDPLSHQTDLGIVHGFSADELAGWYRNSGLRVIETRVSRRSPPARAAAPIHLRRGGQARARTARSVGCYSLATLSPAEPTPRASMIDA